MIEHFYSQRRSAQRLRLGPLEPHLDDYAKLLAEQGYSRQAGRQKLRLAADLSRWLERKRLPVEQLNEQRVREFFGARWRRLRWHNSDQASLALLLRQLRQANVTPDLVIPARASPLDRVAQDYARFLAQERGVVQTTVDNYLPVARRFLVRRSGSGKLRLAALRAHDVREFILRDLAGYSPKRAQLATSALRSFLGHLYQTGQLATNLAGAVPTVSGRPLSGLRQPADRHGPRIHELRHRFSIRTLVHWYRTGQDVEAHLPELATYLGHGHVSDTYWYLSATPGRWRADRHLDHWAGTHPRVGYGKLGAGVRVRPARNRPPRRAFHRGRQRTGCLGLQWALAYLAHAHLERDRGGGA